MTYNNWNIYTGIPDEHRWWYRWLKEGPGCIKTLKIMRWWWTPSVRAAHKRTKARLDVYEEELMKVVWKPEGRMITYEEFDHDETRIN